jgi:hypothetical protein|tara:strand:+ start:83 stop:256 length:174 start_codon:yes stop_codon:yes gene_type:complete
MFEQSAEEKRLKELREADVKFADWALQRVLPGNFMENYYQLLKQYEEEHDIPKLVKD